MVMFDSSKNITELLKPFHKKTNSHVINTIARTGVNSKSTSSRKKIDSNTIYRKAH